MIMPTRASPACGSPQQASQQAFLNILPRLRLHGKVYFRDLGNSERRDEAISEMVALAWCWFVRLSQQGKDASQFASALASYAAKAVRSGRRLCGQEKARDVLSPLAQQRRGFRVCTLPEGSALTDAVLDEALQDNTSTPIPEQVQFRLDFPRWRRSRCARDRSLMDDLMVGERPYQMARKYGLSRPRISLLRRELFEDWSNFCDGVLRSSRKGSPAVPAGTPA